MTGAPGLLPFGRTPKGEIAVDRAPCCANELGDIEDGEPGGPERPHLLVPFHLAGTLLLTGSFRPLLPRDRSGLIRAGQWPEDGVALPRCHLECWSEAEQAPLQRLDQILEDVPTIGHLDRLRRTLAGRFCIRCGAVTADHLETGILAEPGRQGLGLAILEEIDDPSPLQVDQDGAVAMPLPEGPVVDSEHTRSRPSGNVSAAQHTEQGSPTDRRAEASRKPRTGRAAERERDDFQCRSLAQRPSSIGGDQFWEPLGEDGAGTTSRTTSKAADSEAEDQLPTGERQVSDSAVIAAVDTLGPPRTERAASVARGCDKVQPDALAVERRLLEAKTGQMREKRCERHVNPRGS